MSNFITSLQNIVMFCKLNITRICSRDHHDVVCHTLLCLRSDRAATLSDDARLTSDV